MTERRGSGGRLARGLAERVRWAAPFLLAAFALVGVPAGLSHAATPQWTWRASAPIRFQRLTALGTLLVSTSDGLTALDPARGAVAWTRDDVRRLEAPDLVELPGTRYALLYQGEGAGGLKRHVELIDLTTGARCWDTGPLPITGVHGAYAAPPCSLVVLIGPAGGGAPEVVLGVDLPTGALRWRQDGLFAKTPRLRRVAGSGGMLFRAQLDGDMPALLEGPDRMILWVWEDGPRAIDLNDGRTIWHAPIRGPAPSRAAGCAPWRLVGRTVYAPFGRMVQAIDARSGLVVWQSTPPYPDVVGRMQLTPHGLVVQGSRARRPDGRRRGRPFLDLLDPSAGVSRWGRPLTSLADPSPFAVVGETLYVAADRRLLAAALADGATREVAALPLRGGETVTGLEALDGDLLATSSQTQVRLSPRGELRYERYDPAPMAPAWARTLSLLDSGAMNAEAVLFLANSGSAFMFAYALLDGALEDGPARLVGLDPVLTRRYTASREAGSCRVVLAQVEDEDGHRGVGLLKIDKSHGELRGRIVLGDRTPDLAYDPLEHRLFFCRDGREIVCYGF